MPFLRYLRFLGTEIFPNGYLPHLEDIVESSSKEGFQVLEVVSQRHDQALTFDRWLANLEMNQEAALQAVSREVYEAYLRYLRDSAKYFRFGDLNLYWILMQPA